MLFNDLGSYRSYSAWMNTLNSDSTKKVWTRCLRDYCNWRKSSPDQLISKRQNDLTQKDPVAQNDEEVQLHKFMLYLEYQDASSNWRRVYWTAIRNFFKKNYLPLQLFHGEGPPITKRRSGARACTNQELKSMLKSASFRERTLIMFLAHTGLSVDSVADLTLGDLERANKMETGDFERLTPPIKIELTQSKNGIEARTFISSKSWTLLKKYLYKREKGSLKRRKTKKGEQPSTFPPENLFSSSPLFRSYGKWGAKQLPEIKHLQPSSISAIVKNVAKRAGVYEEGFSAYALRRFFKKALETAGVYPNWIRIMMGFKTEKSEEISVKPTWEQLQKAYVKARPYLTGTFQKRDIGAKKPYKRLKKELKNIKLELKKERIWRLILERTSFVDKAGLKDVFEECMKAKNEKAIQEIIIRFKYNAKKLV